MQLAGLLGAAAQAGKSLNATIVGFTGNDTKPAQLVLLDRNLAELGNNIARDVNNTLTALRPPIQVLEGVVRPLAATLNETLGGVTVLLTGPVSGGLTAALQQLQGFANGAIKGVSDALQLPLPQLPPLPGKTDSPNRSPSPSPSTAASPSPSPAASPNPSPSPRPGASLAELQELVDRNIRPTLTALGIANATIDRVVNSTATSLFNIGANNATFVTAISQVGHPTSAVV
jgi:hypothetical protein